MAHSGSYMMILKLMARRGDMTGSKHARGRAVALALIAP